MALASVCCRRTALHRARRPVSSNRGSLIGIQPYVGLGWPSSKMESMRSKGRMPAYIRKAPGGANHFGNIRKIKA
jgi:hypothetical protein